MFSGPYKISSIPKSEFYFYRETLESPLSVSIQLHSFGIYAHAVFLPSQEELINLWISSVLSDSFLSQITLNVCLTWGTTATDKTTHSDVELTLSLDAWSRPIVTCVAPNDTQRLSYQTKKKKVCITDFKFYLFTESSVKWQSGCITRGSREMLSRTLNEIPMCKGSLT